MRQSFSKKFLESNSGCYAIGKLYSCSFMRHDVITLRSILESEIPLVDKYWFVCRLATKEENIRIVIGLAEMVLPIFETRILGDDRPRAVVEGAKGFIKGQIGIHELKALYLDACAACAILDVVGASAAYAAYEAAYTIVCATESVYVAYSGYAAHVVACAAIDAVEADFRINDNASVFWPEWRVPGFLSMLREERVKKMTDLILSFIDNE